MLETARSETQWRLNQQVWRRERVEKARTSLRQAGELALN